MGIRNRLGKAFERIGKGLASDGDEAAFHHGWVSGANHLFLKLIPQENHGYTWGVLQGARLAHALGYERISVIEFGVAAGNGLLSLESVSAKIERMFNVVIDVHGFDNVVGLPGPKDYRDIPHTFSGGDFPMDEAALRAKLKRANLHLGLVSENIARFLASNSAPIAFVSFDLAFYTSTMDALKVLDADQGLLLPRIQCYFDDIFECGDFDGERLAIADFNASRTYRKISPIHQLRYFVPARTMNPASKWDKYYLAYIFDHERYGQNPRIRDRR
ncbi:MAG: hypothetical protein ACREV0_13360 [Burkholderiales bacterium]